VQEGDNEVVVTAYIGTLPAIADRQESGEPLSSMMKPVVRPGSHPLGRSTRSASSAGRRTSTPAL
jgi:hypothetical protein